MESPVAHSRRQLGRTEKIFKANKRSIEEKEGQPQDVPIKRFIRPPPPTPPPPDVAWSLAMVVCGSEGGAAHRAWAS